jgi:DNA-binding response OmpR family regulator
LSERVGIPKVQPGHLDCNSQTQADLPRHPGSGRYRCAGETPVRLTATEMALMRIFAAQPGKPIPRTKLVAEGGPVDAAQERAVDVQITRLRRKIKDDPKAPRYLQTVRGMGSMLQPE